MRCPVREAMIAGFRGGLWWGHGCTEGGVLVSASVGDGAPRVGRGESGSSPTAGGLHPLQ